MCHVVAKHQQIKFGLICKKVINEYAMIDLDSVSDITISLVTAAVKVSVCTPTPTQTTILHLKEL